MLTLLREVASPKDEVGWLLSRTFLVYSFRSPCSCCGLVLPVLLLGDSLGLASTIKESE